MIGNITGLIVDKLSEVCEGAVYSSFDAVSLRRKEKGIFTVVGMSAFESMKPIYSKYTVYVPFTAEAEIKVTAPESWSMLSLYNYYEQKLEPAILSFSDLNFKVKGAAIKPDSNIQRLVLTVTVSVSGVNKIERSDD